MMKEINSEIFKRIDKAKEFGPWKKNLDKCKDGGGAGNLCSFTFGKNTLLLGGIQESSIIFIIIMNKRENIEYLTIKIT